jgi:hypothetical protein
MTRTGYVYVLQVVPELKPTRLKIGFTTRQPDHRVMEFRTVAPTAKCIALWHGDEEMEALAIKTLCLDGQKVGHEVVDVNDLEQALTQLRELFEGGK